MENVFFITTSIDPPNITLELIGDFVLPDRAQLCVEIQVLLRNLLHRVLSGDQLSSTNPHGLQRRFFFSH